jgi:ribosomal protein S14
MNMSVDSVSGHYCERCGKIIPWIEMRYGLCRQCQIEVWDRK